MLDALLATPNFITCAHAQIVAPACAAAVQHSPCSCLAVFIFIHLHFQHSFILNATLELLVSSYSVRYGIQPSFIGIQCTQVSLSAAWSHDRDVLLGEDFYTLYVSE